MSTSIILFCFESNCQHFTTEQNVLINDKGLHTYTIQWRTCIMLAGPGWICDWEHVWEGPVTSLLFFFLPFSTLQKFGAALMDMRHPTTSVEDRKWVCARVETQASDFLLVLPPICFPIINFFQCFSSHTYTESIIYLTGTHINTKHAFLLSSIRWNHSHKHTHAKSLSLSVPQDVQGAF